MVEHHVSVRLADARARVVLCWARDYGSCRGISAADGDGTEERARPRRHTLVAHDVGVHGVRRALPHAARRRHRTTPIFSGSHAARVFGCVTIAALTLLLPQQVFMSSIAPRVASVEGDADFVALLKFHADHGFWRCQTDRGAFEDAIHANQDAIRRDLARYGFVSDFKVSPSISECKSDLPLYSEIRLRLRGDDHTGARHAYLKTD